jgi:hypothetical protein
MALIGDLKFSSYLKIGAQHHCDTMKKKYNCTIVKKPEHNLKTGMWDYIICYPKKNA